MLRVIAEIKMHNFITEELDGADTVLIRFVLVLNLTKRNR